MKIGSTEISNIKIGSTSINKVIKDGVIYWEVTTTTISPTTTIIATTTVTPTTVTPTTTAAPTTTISPEQILSTFGSRMALWTTKDGEQAGYYLDKIGVQDRQALSDGGIAGVLHPGRAISYDNSKSQYSMTLVGEPDTWKIGNNSISYFFRIMMDSAPSTVSRCVGDSANLNGSFYIGVGSDGKVVALVKHATTITYYSEHSICDGIEHSVLAALDKTGYFSLFIDNVLQGSPRDISAISFSLLGAGTFCLFGGIATAITGIKRLRDVRIFSLAITSESDRDKIQAGEYVAGCVAWYFNEGGKEGLIYRIKDLVGTMHLRNYNFDETSLVSGPWPSLLNKFGYSPVAYAGSDLILDDGVFDTAAEWTYLGTRWTVTGGVATFLAIDNTSNRLRNKRTVSIAIGDVIKCSFDIVSGTATMLFGQQGDGTLGGSGTYAIGHHDVVFAAAVAATQIEILAFITTGVFEIDNWTVINYEAAIISPLMDRAVPINDIYGRTLTFFGQAKFNLQKVDEDTVNMPDYVGELFNAAELITVNDWFDAAGVGNEIDLVNIDPYQTKRQYYNAENEELIIFKPDVYITDAEDLIIKRFLEEDSETYTPIYNVDVAIGALEGTTAEIYMMTPAILASTPVKTVQAITPVASDLNPANKYIAMGWADFFIGSDQIYTMPLIAKYNAIGFASTFYIPARPSSLDYRNTFMWDPSKIKMIEQCGSWDGEHGFHHIGYLMAMPEYDGRLCPSANDLRVARGDGTNEWGHDINATVDSTITAAARGSYLRLDPTLGAKAWKDLTDADCLAITRALGMFGMPFDMTGNQHVLQALDYLSNRYCGTSGLSVCDDYTTRTPNTVDGLEPSINNRIIGGVFQGAASTQNQEIWERVVYLMKEYKDEFLGKINPHYFYSTSGGITRYLFFDIENPPTDYVRYTNKSHTKLVNGAAKYTSSITGVTRTAIEVVQAAGYICGMSTYGDCNYADPQSDGISRLEGQRIYKRNGLKKPDNAGDGYVNSLRCWDATIPEADQNTLLGTADLVKALYDYTFGDARYAGMLETESAFHVELNAICKYNAWGMTPDFVADSLSTQVGNASYILVLEALYQFCKRAGITVISHEQAALMGMTKILPTGYNYFPNNTFDKTPATITASANALTYPDGWNGGVVINEDTGAGATNVLHKNTDGTIFTRQYAIKPGTFNLSFKAKGVGTLKVRKILNKDTYINTVGTFTEINSIAINSAGIYTTYTATVTIPDAVLESYSAPATPQEEAYQNYMKGYGDKICGIQIELIIAGGNYVKIGNCSLIE